MSIHSSVLAGVRTDVREVLSAVVEIRPTREPTRASRQSKSDDFCKLSKVFGALIIRPLLTALLLQQCR